MSETASASIVSAYPRPPIYCKQPAFISSEEIDWPQPPLPPSDGKYTVFGVTHQLNESEKRPSDESVHEYFEEDALRSGKACLEAIHHILTELFSTFLAVLDTTVTNPFEADRCPKVEQLQHLFINAHFLLNHLRLQQAKKQLLESFQDQIQQKRSLIEALERSLNACDHS